MENSPEKKDTNDLIEITRVGCKKCSIVGVAMVVIYNNGEQSISHWCDDQKGVQLEHSARDLAQSVEFENR